MPGIAGFVMVDSIVDAAGTLDQMLDSLKYRTDGCRFTRVWRALRSALGAETLSHISPGVDSFASSTTDLIIDGELYGERDLVSQSNALRLSFQADNISSFETFRGAFAAAFVDSERKKLFLCSDKFGSKPLYWTKVGNGLAFSSEVKALFRIPGLKLNRCDRAYADFYRFGFAMGERTLIEGVELLPPGTILTFDFDSGNVTQQSYFSASSLFVSAENYRSDLDMGTVAEQFVVAVKRRLGNFDKIGISLSGGLDSRAILAAMGERARDVPSYTLGLPGCEDERLTERLAQVSGTKHDFLPLGKEYLDDFEGMARALVTLSDGLYHPHESTEKRALDYFRTQPFGIVLRGHAGELAKASLAYPLAANSELHACQGSEQATAYAFERANLVLRDLNPEDLFSPHIVQVVKDGPRQSLSEVVSALPDGLAPEDLCLFLYLTQWVRRQVLASLAIFRSQVDVRLPYLDEDFLQLLLSLPVKSRWDGELQREVVQRYMPALGKIPNSNTGAPLDAGPLRLFVTDKINSVFRRLSLPGFRHYTEFDRWQREHFRTALERILFDERTLSRGLYRQEGLQSLFDAHISGKKNYAHMLGTVAGLEIWQREFLD